MNKEQNFYDILRSKFNEREASFDEENWKSMREMIDASRDAKKRAIWLVASLAILLCAGGAFAVYNWTNGSGKSNTAYTGAAANNSPKVAVSSKQTNNAATPAETANTAKIASSNKQPAISNNASIGNNQNSINGIVQSPAAVNTSASFYKKNRRNHTHSSKTGGEKIASNNAISSNKEEYANNNAQVASHNATIEGATKIQSANPAIPSQKTSVASNPLTSKATTSAAKTGSHKTDSAATGDLPARFSDEPRIFMGKTNLLSVEIGAQYSGGWQIGSVVQGRGLNPIVGIGYQHYMGSKVFLKTGIQFSTFGNMSPLTYNYQHSVGKVIYDSVITTQRLYFLRIPLQAEYFVGRKKRSSVGIGGSAWFLLGNSGYATTYQQVDNNPPVNAIKYSQNAPLNGYSKVDGSAYFLYRYMFTHKFSIYGMVYFEFTNMKDNAFFGENIIERTRGGQVMLSYNLN